MKTWLRNGLELLAVILLLPQVFVFLYYFRYLFAGSNGVELLRTLVVHALTISWVAAPFLVLLTLAARALIRVNARWLVTFGLCVAAGYVWVAAWNTLVCDEFSYAWAALPVLLCGGAVAAYGAARKLYLESLGPVRPPAADARAPAEPAKNAVPDLSE